MRRILVVEDEEILREMYEAILSTQPYLVDLAEHGEIALELCRTNAYDLILLDLMMPVLDGVGFLKRFTPVAPPHTRIIVLSNLSFGEEIEAAAVQGIHRTVLKADVSPRQLIAMIRYELDAFTSVGDSR